MQTMRDGWTDERLDDLNGRVSDGFHQVDERFDRVEAGVRDLRGEMIRRFERVDEVNEALRADIKAGFEGIHRTLIQCAGVVIAALIGLVATQL